MGGVVAGLGLPDVPEVLADVLRDATLRRITETELNGARQPLCLRRVGLHLLSGR